MDAFYTQNHIPVFQPNNSLKIECVNIQHGLFRISSHYNFLQCVASVSVELPVSNTAQAQHVNYASYMTDRIYIQNCIAILLTQYTVDVFSIFSFQILLTRVAVMVAKWFSSLPPRRPTKL